MKVRDLVRHPALTIALAGLAAALLVASSAQAGGQGPGIQEVPAPDGLAVASWLENPPSDVPPARFVCVDAPSTECIDLDASDFEGGVVTSPDCPSGPAARACRPDAIPGTQLEGRLAVSYSILPRVDVSEEYDGRRSEIPFRFRFPSEVIDAVVFPADYEVLLAPEDGDSPYATSTSFEIANLPAFLDITTNLIQTDPADASSKSSSLLRFQLGSCGGCESHLYVAYDGNAAVQPSWLTNSFTPLADTVDLRPLPQPPGGLLFSFRIWKSNRTYPEGSLLTLGGNGVSGQPNPLMYFVFVKPPLAWRYCQGYETSLSVLDPSGESEPLGDFVDEGCYDLEPNTGAAITRPLNPLGLGWFTSERACDDLGPIDTNPGPLEIERSLSTMGAIDRGAIRRIARTVFPAQLCQPDASGLCTVDPAVTFVEPNGSLSGFARVDGDPNLCSFPIRFARPAQQRSVVAGPPANDVDTGGFVVGPFASTARGLIADVDLLLQTTSWGGQLNFLLKRVPYSYPGIGGDPASPSWGYAPVYSLGSSGCGNITALNLRFDDEATLGRSGCSPQIGRVRPDTANLFARYDGLPTARFWELWIDDPFHPGTGTDLTSWKLIAETRSTACTDGLDNDGDGSIDWDGGAPARLGNEVGPSDPGCVSFGDDDEIPPLARVEGKVLPEQEGFTHRDTTTGVPPPFVEGGVLQPNATPPAGRRDWLRSDLPLGDFATTGAVMDARVKIIEAGFLQTSSVFGTGFSLWMTDAIGRAAMIGFATDGLYVSTDASQAKAQSSAFIPFSTIPSFRETDFNRYRLDASGGVVTLEVNGDPVVSVTRGSGAALHGTRNLMQFGDSSTSSLGSWVAIDSIRFTSLTPACQNGLDDDDDGVTDLADAGCSDAADRSERGAAFPCDDGKDNDEDGLADFGGDPVCIARDFEREQSRCQNGISDDADGLVDFDGGASLNGGVALTQPDPQCVGRPHRTSEAVSCGLGAELAVLAGWVARRRRRAGGRIGSSCPPAARGSSRS